MKDLDLKRVAEHIIGIEKHVERLMEMSEGIDALECNLKRIMASIRILKLNFLDPEKFDDG